MEISFYVQDVGLTEGPFDRRRPNRKPGIILYRFDARLGPQEIWPIARNYETADVMPLPEAEKLRDRLTAAIEAAKKDSHAS